MSNRRYFTSTPAVNSRSGSGARANHLSSLWSLAVGQETQIRGLSRASRLQCLRRAPRARIQYRLVGGTIGFLTCMRSSGAAFSHSYWMTRKRTGCPRASRIVISRREDFGACSHACLSALAGFSIRTIAIDCTCRGAGEEDAATARASMNIAQH